MDMTEALSFDQNMPRAAIFVECKFSAFHEISGHDADIMLPEKRLFAYHGDQIRKAADRDIDLPRFQLSHKPGAPQRNRRKAHKIGRASCRERECQHV